MQRQESGFTLVELSIVLVIIGLIVGGVLAGQSMIRSAAIQSVMRDEQSYVAAVNNFQLKYNALPGDMKNATAFWGTNPNCASGGAGTGTQTCNGNGDGVIFYIWGSTSDVLEMYQIWQHLANAGLIPGSFPGAATSLSIGVNVPASKIPGAGFSLINFGACNGGCSDPGWFTQNYGNAILFGATHPPNPNIGAVLTTQEAYGIDQKLDDGMPGSGQVTTGENSSLLPLCVSSTNPAAATYVLTQSGNQCILLFKTGL